MSADNLLTIKLPLGGSTANIVFGVDTAGRVYHPNYIGKSVTMDKDDVAVCADYYEAYGSFPVDMFGDFNLDIAPQVIDELQLRGHEVAVKDTVCATLFEQPGAAYISYITGVSTRHEFGQVCLTSVKVDGLECINCHIDLAVFNVDTVCTPVEWGYGEWRFQARSLHNDDKIAYAHMTLWFRLF